MKSMRSENDKGKEDPLASARVNPAKSQPGVVGGKDKKNVPGWLRRLDGHDAG